MSVLYQTSEENNDDDVVFDDVYELCEVIGKWVKYTDVVRAAVSANSL